MTLPISRRTLLRGAGAALALPFLEAMLPARAATAAKPPKRLGIFSVTGGTVMESWKPREVGPLTKLPSILQPLEFAKKDLVIVSGLSHTGRTEGLNGHEHCAYLHLTGAPLAKKDKGTRLAGVSVDQSVAKGIGKETLFSSLEFGMTNQETVYSWRSAQEPVPYESNPRLVFERMFRGRQPIVPNWHRRQTPEARAALKTSRSDSYDQSVLDLVLEDANDLRRGLGKADQRKLDEYLNAVRGIETRIQFIEARLRLERLDSADPGPSKIDALSLPPTGNAYWEFWRQIHQDPERHADYIRIVADLFVLAFQTDTTRVATIALGSDEALFPGVVTVGYERHCHTLEHRGAAHGPAGVDPVSREALRQIHAWYTQLFAEMARKMKNIDEGGSSLLDNSLLLYTSYMAHGNHGTDDYPAALVGGAGGALKGGRHLAYKYNTPVANLYVEMLNLMGVPTERFGDSHTSRHQNYDGRLPGLV